MQRLSCGVYAKLEGDDKVKGCNYGGEHSGAFQGSSKARYRCTKTQDHTRFHMIKTLKKVTEDVVVPSFRQMRAQHFHSSHDLIGAR